MFLATHRPTYMSVYLLSNDDNHNLMLEKLVK